MGVSLRETFEVIHPHIKAKRGNKKEKNGT